MMVGEIWWEMASSGSMARCWPMAGTWRPCGRARDSALAYLVCEKAVGQFEFHVRHRQIRRSGCLFQRDHDGHDRIQIAYESVAPRYPVPIDIGRGHRRRGARPSASLRQEVAVRDDHSSQGGSSPPTGSHHYDTTLCVYVPVRRWPRHSVWPSRLGRSRFFFCLSEGSG